MSNNQNLSTSQILSAAISDNFSNLKLEFVEHNKQTNCSYPVDLILKGIKYVDEERVVFYGDLTVSSFRYGTGTIEYQFRKQNFDRVTFSNRTNRSRKRHAIVAGNTEDIRSLLFFISSFIHFLFKEGREQRINESKSKEDSEQREKANRLKQKIKKYIGSDAHSMRL
jgi:hypothetical protein